MEGLVLTGVALLVGAVIGAVELIKAAISTEWRTVVIIVVAGFIGFIFGTLDEIGITGLQGMVVGLAASGVITLGKTFGK